MNIHDLSAQCTPPGLTCGGWGGQEHGEHVKPVSDVFNFVTWCVVLLEVAIKRLRNALKDTGRSTRTLVVVVTNVVLKCR